MEEEELIEEELIIETSSEFIVTDIPQLAAETVDEYTETTTEQVLENGLTYSQNIAQISDCSKGIFVFMFFFLVALVCKFFFRVLSWFF